MSSLIKLSQLGWIGHLKYMFQPNMNHFNSNTLPCISICHLGIHLVQLNALLTKSQRLLVFYLLNGNEPESAVNGGYVYAETCIDLFL